MISDFLIILTVAGFILLGIWRGAARTLLNLAAVMISAIIARFAAVALAQAVYNSFFKATVTDNIAQLIQQNGEQFASQHSMKALPESIKGLIAFAARLFGVSTGDLQGRLVSSTAVSQQAAAAIEQPLGELAVCVLSVLFMMIIFVVLTLAFKPLIRLVLGFFEIPVIRGLNKALGGILGALEGAVVVLVAVNLLYVLISCTNPALTESETVFGALFKTLIIID